MRSYKIILIFVALFICNSLYSQNYLTVRGGVGGGNIRLKPLEETKIYFGTPLAGISYRYIGGDNYLGSIEVGLNYVQKGYQQLPRMNSDSAYIRTINSLQLTFLWKPYVYFNKKRSQIYALAGPYLNYDLSSRERYHTKELGDLYDRKYNYNVLKDNRTGYGLSFGLGYLQKVSDKIAIFADARFDWALSDILKNMNKYPTNPLESPLDFISASVGVEYNFGKNLIKRKGKLAPVLE